MTAAFVAMSRFTIANGMEDEVHAAFRNRPHLVDREPGFVRMEVLVPRDNPSEIWLMTWWQDEASYALWHRGHAYHEAHAGIPKGLKLVRGSTVIQALDRIAD